MDEDVKKIWNKIEEDKSIAYKRIARQRNQRGEWVWGLFYLKQLDRDKSIKRNYPNNIKEKDRLYVIGIIELGESHIGEWAFSLDDQCELIKAVLRNTVKPQEKERIRKKLEESIQEAMEEAEVQTKLIL